MWEELSKDNRPSYGGQAVIEGVMMRGPGHMALSVRDPEGNIVSLTGKVENLSEQNKVTRLPVIRGAVSLFESLSLGIQMLMKSAEIAAPEEEKPSDNALTLAVAFAVVMGLGLFVILPSYVTAWFVRYLAVSGRYWVSFIESALRLLFLIAYVVSISRMKDIQRVLEYHGAEHKVIWAYEKNYSDLEGLLTGGSTRDIQSRQCSRENQADAGSLEHCVEFLVEKAKPESSLHPRCGTSFLFIAVLVTWIVFLFMSPKSLIVRIVARIAMLPVVAGLAYEVLRRSAKGEGFLWGLVKAPGIAMQRLTTREPDKGQLEVAATSLVLLIIEESNPGAHMNSTTGF